jgi:ligand-binding sensor domain-containing protein/two-component sensor histidine kinase
MSSPGRILSPIFIILWLGTWAQHKIPVYAKRCPVKTINYEEGLMDNSITAVITDAEGFTWVSTSTGIQRYNGYTLQPITPVVTGDTIRIDYPVFFLKEKDNTLLIGYREGILGFSTKTNSFTRVLSRTAPGGGHPLSPPGSARSHSLMPLSQTAEGIWCFDEESGIVLYRRDGDSINRSPSIVDTTNLNLIRTEEYLITRKLVACNENYIFMRLSLNKILQIDMRTHQEKQLDYPDSLITGLECNDDKLFVSTSAGVFVRAISTGLITKRFLIKWISNDPNVTRSSVELSSDGRLLVSEEGRLFEFDTAGNCHKEIISLNRDPLLKTGYIQIIYEDPFRRIWLLTNGDIKRIEDVETPFSYLTYPNEQSHFIRSLYYDDGDKTLLAAAFLGPIELYDSAGNPMWPAALTDKRATNPIAIDKVSDHRYLIITVGNGWFLLNSSTRRLQPLSPGHDAEIRNNSYFNNLQRIDDSTLMFSTRSNVFSCRIRKGNTVVQSALLSDSAVQGLTLTCFLRSKDKTLWAATQSGAILRLDPAGNLHRIAIPENYIRAIAEDGMHHIWIGSESGIFVYDGSGRLIRHLSRQAGLLNDIIYALLPADNTRNNFFASTSFGLSSISATGAIMNYPRELGLQENEFNTLSCARSADGRLFFGGINGITAFYPSELTIPRDSAKITVVRFAVNDSAYNSFGSSWEKDTIRLPYDQEHLQFDVAATGLLNPNEYLYRYRLQGFDRSWQTTTQPTGIRYILQPGTYWLDINCSPVLFSTRSTQKRIMIIISPPWWKTWWFILGCIVIAVLIIFGISYFILHQRYVWKLRQLAVDQQLVRERERISRELHDNIGTQLSYISNSIDWLVEAPYAFDKEEEKNRLAAVNDTARNLVIDLRETIWAMKKEFILLDEFADKLKLYLQSQTSLQPRMETVITEDIRKKYTFSPTEALNIFRICQEAIANSVRHSGADQICLSIQSGYDKDFSFTIEDNGQGFIRQQRYDGHYGLENMTHRAAESGATLSVETGPGRGTRVTVSK